LEPESKKLFDKVTAVDENGDPVELEGHEKFMEAFGGIESGS